MPLPYGAHRGMWASGEASFSNGQQCASLPCGQPLDEQVLEPAEVLPGEGAVYRLALRVSRVKRRR